MNEILTVNNWCFSFKKFLSLFKSRPDDMFDFVVSTRKS